MTLRRNACSETRREAHQAYRLKPLDQETPKRRLPSQDDRTTLAGNQNATGSPVSSSQHATHASLRRWKKDKHHSKMDHRQIPDDNFIIINGDCRPIHATSGLPEYLNQSATEDLVHTDGPLKDWTQQLNYLEDERQESAQLCI